MSDETTTTPEQQDTTPAQQAGGNPADNWEARFKGLQTKYNVLVNANGELESQLADVTSKLEHYEKQLANMSVEKDSLTNQHKNKIDELTSKLTEYEGNLSELKQYQLKVKVAREMGHPELVKVIDSIPNSEDEEAIKNAFKNILDLTSDFVKRREEQLIEGLSPGEAGGDESVLPASEQGWMDYIDSFQLGSKDRVKAQDQYFEFLNSKR